MSKVILITGGCGFIGHHFVEHILKNTDWRIVILDKLTYASSGFDRLRDIEAFDSARVETLAIDLNHAVPEGAVREIGTVDYIVHMAAETHVDNSIQDPEPFVISNVLGTMHILNLARRQKSLKRFIYFSTDEVFGPATADDCFEEWDRYNSSNPYAATKAGGEELCLAYSNTYRLPVVITHCMNVFGQRQHPEKFIPMSIRKIMLGETITIHADADRSKPGSRFYIHARNVADAVLFLLDHSTQRDKYNIVGDREVDNLNMVQFIADVIGKPLHYTLTDFHSSRPGHDLRYAISGKKLAELGWTHKESFEESLRKTILWTLERPIWLGMDAA